MTRQDEPAAAGDVEYFQQRAELELELAQSATHGAAVRAHYELAGYYLDRVHNPDGDAASGPARSDLANGGIS
jgi:hypothetical protein